MIRPVKRIECSDKDQQQLAHIRNTRTLTQSRQPSDYRRMVVVKPWGYEFLMFENEHVAIWYLAIQKDHATSMHCHPSKRTALSLLMGKALCNTFRHRNFLSAGDSLIIDSGAFHSTKALSMEGVALLEMETPPDKLDLVRLEDGYGRENNGYEGDSQMVLQNLEEFRYFFLSEEAGGLNRFVAEGRFSIDLEQYKSGQSLELDKGIEAGALYCVCRGHLLNEDGSTVARAGDTQRGALLGLVKGLRTVPGTLLMRILVFE